MISYPFSDPEREFCLKEMRHLFLLDIFGGRCHDIIWRSLRPKDGCQIVNHLYLVHLWQGLVSLSPPNLNIVVCVERMLGGECRNALSVVDGWVVDWGETDHPGVRRTKKYTRFVKNVILNFKLLDVLGGDTRQLDTPRYSGRIGILVMNMPEM